MAQHTETKWKTCLPPEYTLPYISSANGTPIARMFGGMKDGEMEANAQFIVKACNNYEALVEALKTLIMDEVRIHDSTFGDGVFIREHDLNEYREVLANIGKGE